MECQNPYLVSLPDWKATIEKQEAADSSNRGEWVLINSPPLFGTFGDLGSIPSTAEYQTAVLDQTLEYALALNVKRVHLVMKDIEKPDQM